MHYNSPTANQIFKIVRTVWEHWRIQGGQRYVAITYNSMGPVAVHCQCTESIQSCTMNTTGHEARTLLNSLLKADFLMSLVCLPELSALLRSVSLFFSKKVRTWCRSLHDINDVLAVLSRWRDKAELEFGLYF